MGSWWWWRSYIIVVIVTTKTITKTRNFVSWIHQLYPAKGGNTRQNCQGQINNSCFNLKADLFFCHFNLSPLFSRQWWVWAGDHANAGEWDWSVRIFTVKLSKHSHQRTKEQIAIVTSTRIKGMFSSMCIQLPPSNPKRKPKQNPSPVSRNRRPRKKKNKQVRRAGQRDEMTASSAMGCGEPLQSL